MDGNGLNYKLHAQTETIIEYIVDVGGYHECPKRYNHDLGGNHFFGNATVSRTFRTGTFSAI